MRIGKTIVGEREKTISESERMEARKKLERNKKLRLAVFIAIIILFGVGVGAVIKYVADIRNREDVNVVTDDTYTPTVEIRDESGANYITDKMKKYVGKIERDFRDLGYMVTQAIVTEGKTREIDIYLKDREEYYKCNLDRGTAETAEDAKVMIKYLDKNNIKATYVDVRLAGKAYYK